MGTNPIVPKLTPMRWIEAIESDKTCKILFCSYKPKSIKTMSKHRLYNVYHIATDEVDIFHGKQKLEIHCSLFNNKIGTMKQLLQVSDSIWIQILVLLECRIKIMQHQKTTILSHATANIYIYIYIHATWFMGSKFKHSSNILSLVIN